MFRRLTTRFAPNLLRFPSASMSAVYNDRAGGFDIPLPPPLPSAPVISLPALLPQHLQATPSSVDQKKIKHTLVLDIDNTLLEAGGGGSQYGLYFRPYLAEFFTEVNRLFEVVIWTAGTTGYLSMMIHSFEKLLGIPISPAYSPEADHMDPQIRPLSWYGLARKSTVGSSWTKFLPAMGRPMSSVLLLDDRRSHFVTYPRNGVASDHYCCSSYRIRDLLKEAGQLNATKKVGEYYVDVDMDVVEKAQPELAKKLLNESDTQLLDFMPMLRAVAAAPDVPRELDYWRPDGYEATDRFGDGSNLGTVTKVRRATPIPLPTSSEENDKTLNAYFSAAGADPKTMLDSYEKWAKEVEAPKSEKQKADTTKKSNSKKPKENKKTTPPKTEKKGEKKKNGKK